MVTRKPVPSRNTDQPRPSAPYPASPTAPSAPTGYASVYPPTDSNHDGGLSPQRTRSSSASSHNTWNSGFSSDHDDQDDNLPREESKAESSAIPASLRVGKSQASDQPQQPFNSHNPYNNLHSHSQHQPPSLPYPGHHPQPSPAPPTAAPPPPPPPPQAPPFLPPAEPFAALSLGDYEQSNQHADNLEPPPPEIPQKSSRRSLISQASSSNPWQQDLDREQQSQNAFNATPSPQPQPENTFQPPPGPPPSYAQPAHAQNQQSVPFPPPAPPAPLAFNAPSSTPNAPPLPPQSPQHAPPAPPVPPAAVQPNPFALQPPSRAPVQQSDNLIDLGTEQTSRQETNNESAPIPEPHIQPATSTESPEELLKKQRNETYQIKQINWFDTAAGPNGSLRRCPILTQNANGPCPLLALVNALTLSAPESPQTILVGTLCSREQISLGLLLDAVFEELARRTEISSKALPDVSDLYSFLITLHTGMNVNPRFVAPANAPDGAPGSFEETREMRLYSTFDIPLVHGWIPPSHSTVYEAFDRSAKTFDEALNVQFAQAELEHKLGEDGLTAQEQQMFEDIIFIKEFLAGYPTQLTEHGLKVISDFLKPGQIAILFRNDHFSTLYKQPRTGTLMNLVTDAGYSSHNEIVWESLVDVNGSAGGFFSGDFRPVGNASSSGTENAGQGWQTVQPRNNRNSRGGNSTTTSSGASQQPAELQRHKSSEQEDADLALALQLQEEEEDNQRREQAARRRQDELSRQYIDREAASSGQNPSSEQRPPIPPRRSNINNGTSTCNANRPPPTADAPYIRGRESADDEPPTYEQAASDRPFRPPGATSTPRQGDALGALTALQMQSGPFASQNGNSSPQPPSMHRRRSSTMGLGRTNSASQRLRRQQSQGQVPSNLGPPPQAAPQYSGYVPPGSGGRMSQAEREERCIVM